MTLHDADLNKTIWLRWIPPVVLMVGAYLIYANTFGHAWTYDDFPVLVENPDIRSLANFFTNERSGRPLRELTYLIDHTFFGLEPAGYHLQNIFWHALSAILIGWLVLKLGGNRLVAWGSAALFLVHPIQVEVVANISHRKDSLALAWGLMSLLAYVTACRDGRHRLRWVVVALVAWGISLSAKQNALVLPGMVIAYEWLFLAKEERLLFRKPVIASALIGVGGIFATWWTVSTAGLDLSIDELPRQLNRMNHPSGTVEDYIRMVMKSWAFLFSKLAWPVDLAPEYLLTVPKRWLDPWIVGTFIGLFAWLAGLAWSWRRSPLAAWALLWIGLLWLPTSNLLPTAYFAADRYLYAPMVGLSILLVIVVDVLVKSIRPLPVVIVAMLVLLLCPLTWRQNRIWADPMTLWSHAYTISPTSSSVLFHLGLAHDKAGQYPEAIGYYQASAKNFNWPSSYYNLGLAYEKMGRKRDAIRYLCFYVNSKGKTLGTGRDEVKLYLQETYRTTCW